MPLCPELSSIFLCPFSQFAFNSDLYYSLLPLILGAQNYLLRDRGKFQKGQSCNTKLSLCWAVNRMGISPQTSLASCPWISEGQF